MFLEPTGRDFDQLAEQVTKSFMAGSGDGKLEDLIVKCASDMKLNPIEIRRLTEKSNSLSMVKLLKLSQDKKVEFDMADPDRVITKSTGTSALTPKETSKLESSTSSGFELPDLRQTDAIKTAADKVFIKQAAEQTADTPIPKSLGDYFRMSRKKEELQQQKVACVMRFHDGVDYLLSEFGKYYAPDFSKFANEVVTLHGPVAEPLVKAVAAALDEEHLELTKVAGLIDDTTKLHKTATECLSQLSQLVELNRQLDVVTSELTETWDGLVK